MQFIARPAKKAPTHRLVEVCFLQRRRFSSEECQMTPLRRVLPIASSHKEGDRTSRKVTYIFSSNNRSFNR
jgi:hypothetical protein